MKDLINSISKHYRDRTLLKAISNKINNNVTYISYYYRDIRNKIKYGKDAPIFAERIWINPLDCKEALEGRHILSGVNYRKNSGRVIEYPWPSSKAIPIKEVNKINFCIDHWVNGTSWENTGVYEYISKFITERGEWDRCKNIDDIVKRYNNLDLIFDQIKKEGRLKSKGELNPKNFREEGGVIVHIGPEGKIFFGFNGCHRFSIALILGLKMPVQIGYVHRSAISFLPELRKRYKQKV